jgi:hypothetical protein
MSGGQTRLGSAVESCLNVASGFVLSMVMWQWVVAPLYGYEVTLSTNLGITTIFTGVSLIRGYLWRRLFERRNRSERV